MDALVFSWSGSFRAAFDDRAAAIRSLVAFGHDRGFEVGLVAEEEREDVEDDVMALDLDLDFVVGHVEDIREVLRALHGRYDKVFFVSDVPAELAAVNRSGAFTVGYGGGGADADELGGVGPNYIVDDLGELEQILTLEGLKD